MLLEDNADLVALTDPDLPATVSVSPGATVTADRDTEGLCVLTVDAGPGGDVRVTLTVPLGTAEGYWYPRAATPPLMADWSGTDRCHLTSSSPIGCLYDHTGSSLLGFAADTLVDE